MKLYFKTLFTLTLTSLILINTAVTSEKCQISVIEELTGRVHSTAAQVNFSSILRTLKSFKSISAKEFNQDFHKILMSVSELSESDKLLLLNKINTGEFSSLGNNGEELLRLATH